MSKKSFRYIIFVGVIFLLLWTLAPLYVVFISSITPDKDLLNVPPTWIPTPDLSNYAYVLTSGEEGGTAWLFRKSLVNSFIVAASVTVLCLFIGGLAGYAFSRFALPFKDKLLFLVLFTQMLPVITVVIPLYLIFSTLHMLDRLITLVIVYSSFTLPLVIWLLKGFFDTIPADLEEAAMVDGSTLLGAFFRIVVPLSIPGVIATGGLAFLAAWNEFMIVLVFTNTAASKTMPVAIAEFIGRFRVDYGLMCSVGIIASLLPVALALVFQKYLVQGLSAGGVKG